VPEAFAAVSGWAPNRQSQILKKVLNIFFFIFLNSLARIFQARATAR
jgi:hypothetical protein